MIVPDVNLLLYAHVAAFREHALARRWWEGLMNGTREVGVAAPALFGFVRLVSSPRVLDRPLPVEDAKAMGLEWDPADVRGYFDALKGYNVAAVFYGHTHTRNVFRWDGSPKKAEKGVPVFNVAKGGHFSSQQQAFFYVEVGGGKLSVREYQTKDAWETGRWAPTSWLVPVKKAVT